MIYIFINVNASSENSISKWQDAKRILLDRNFSFEEVLTNNLDELQNYLRNIKINHDTTLISAGGDGGIHHLINLCHLVYTKEELSMIKFGAISLGSSNDFHKPITLIQNYSYKVSNSTYKQDLIECCLHLNSNETQIKYCAVNASVGATATGNYFFNTNKVVQKIKKYSFELANAYTLLNLLLKPFNQTFNLQLLLSDGENIYSQNSNFTNIAILKNPHVSGSMRYDTNINPNDGFIDVALIDKINSFNLLKVIIDLHLGKFKGKAFTHTYRCTEIKLSSKQTFSMEIDGELYHNISSADLKIKPLAINVCEALI
jgi:diacylglycerol kinase (ATP)